ncbi:hypothetical protein D854_gp66 [Streptomyces phage R4]|uniref:DUF7298 domain-containing protein n=2 Tax=Arequatrovirus TaxID=1982881 RepID=K4HY77_9CAUD|nr:hypothetical protein D854_gp66 [Streptomyces phage R4]AFU62076.1 hypothetical protein R4_23 [Streptomyces phage R4]
MGLLSADHMPRGVVALTTGLDDTPYISESETMVYQLPFTAAPKRIYKVTLRVGRADTNGTGDQAGDVNRYGKNSLVTRCRWASGSTVTTSGAGVGDYRVTVFDDDSTSATGVCATWFIVNPPAGQTAVGIAIYAGRTAATYGQVRYIADGGAVLVVEDVGPYSE